MDSWLHFAMGPLFRLSLAACLLGLGYRVVMALYLAGLSWYRAADKRVAKGAALRATSSWLGPAKVLRTRPVYSAASFLFHVGLLAIPLFYVGHTALWQGVFPILWPELGRSWADLLSLVTLAGLAVVLSYRIFSAHSRRLSKGGDLALLAVLFSLVLTGVLAAHPQLAPWQPRGWLLVHVLLGDLALVLTPTTKLVHCVLFPFSQLQWELSWRFPAKTGSHVALVLDGKKKEIQS